MVASSYHFHGNAVAAFVIGIAVTFAFGIVQSGCYNGCQRLREWKEATSLVVITNGSIDDLSDCVPFKTTFLYVCKDRETHQFNPSFTPEKLFRICTSNGWLDGNGFKPYYSPHCVKREEHCRSLPAEGNPNILVQIDGLNINVDKNSMTSVYYSDGTIITYKCKESKRNAKDSQRRWRCNKNGYWFPNYNWEPWEPKNDPKEKYLVCNNLSGETLVDGDDKGSPESVPTQTDYVKTQPPSVSSNTHTPTPFLSPSEGNGKVSKEPSTTNASFKNVNPRNETQMDHILIGIFSSLGIVVLIAVLFGVLHKKRARRSKRYEDISDHARQIRFTSTPEEKNKLEQNFADGEEETLQYVNIIPIEVNQEIIYTEVETGKIAGNNSGPTAKRNIDDDSTVYAEIHHSSIPKD